VITRRTALLGGASTLLLTACGGRPARTIAGNGADVPVLTTALEVERSHVALYETGLELIDDDRRALLDTILAHERRHALALEEAIRELGGTPAQPRAAAGYRRGIPNDPDAWLRYAAEAEERAAAGYAAALPKIVNRRLRGTFGALMTSEVEHAAALELR
jgi:rubrerythrin